jgi:Xaa-Pro aminopeptidase
MPFFRQRLQHLTSHFSSRNIDALLIFKSTNIRYLTGFPAGDAWLLVTPQKTYYLTDNRYADEVRLRVPHVTVICLKVSLFKTLFDLVEDKKIKNIGFDENHLSLATFRVLQQGLRSAQLRPISGSVEMLRLYKDPEEVGYIRGALRVHQEALALCKKWVKSGLRERDVLIKLQNYINKRGVSFSFEPIVASGPNSAYAHALVTDRIIRRNDLVLMDFGVDVNGYKSDLTRIFFLGRIAPLLRNIFTAVAEAQRRSIEMIKPGVPTAAVDRAAREYLKTKKLNQYFSHSLGHGVGLEIHEAPRLSEKDPTILKPGMVVTVEPGVYIPGVGGIRIEDMVLVTEKGNEVLSERWY